MSILFHSSLPSIICSSSSLSFSLYFSSSLCFSFSVFLFLGTLLLSPSLVLYRFFLPLSHRLVVFIGTCREKEEKNGLCFCRPSQQQDMQPFFFILFIASSLSLPFHASPFPLMPLILSSSLSFFLHPSLFLPFSSSLFLVLALILKRVSKLGSFCVCLHALFPYFPFQFCSTSSHFLQLFMSVSPLSLFLHSLSLLFQKFFSSHSFFSHLDCLS